MNGETAGNFKVIEVKNSVLICLYQRVRYQAYFWKGITLYWKRFPTEEERKHFNLRNIFVILPVAAMPVEVSYSLSLWPGMNIKP